MTKRKARYSNGSEDERQACKIHVTVGFQDDCQWCWMAHLRLGKITELPKNILRKVKKP